MTDVCSKCEISGGSGAALMTNAELDIMYIDLQRRWEHMNHDRFVGTRKCPFSIVIP